MLATLRAHLMTVGVISAQKKMLSVLTAWEENIPMMENATENFLFRLSRRTAHRKGKPVSPARKSLELKAEDGGSRAHLCRGEGCIFRSLDPSGEDEDEEEEESERQ